MSRVAKVLANAPKARMRQHEFSILKIVLAGNELERHVPRTREDYWRGILETIVKSKRTDTSSITFAHGEARPYIP